MAGTFSVITEEYVDDLEAIRSLVATAPNQSSTGKTRLAAANSATLLLAATFEEFVREMAREYARNVVRNSRTFDELPPKIAGTAWKRTMEKLSKVKFENAAGITIGNSFGAAQAQFSNIYDFCRGDLSKDIYRDLIHNENNMRPGEINGLFKVSGLGDICLKVSDKQALLDEFGETEPGKTHGRLIRGLEEFFERRNAIAHALNPGQSSSPEQISTDIGMLGNFGRALHETLDALLSSPQAAQNASEPIAGPMSVPAPVTPSPDIAPSQ